MAAGGPSTVNVFAYSSNCGVSLAASANVSTKCRWYSVAYSPSVGRFVAVGQRTNPGTYQLAAYSDDGINWTQTASANDNGQWKSVEWYDNGGVFIAVTNAASTGDGLQSALWSADGTNRNTITGAVPGVTKVEEVVE